MVSTSCLYLLEGNSDVKKRGQVSIFAILGIILVLAVALIIVFQEEITTFLPERIFPSQTSAVERFIEGCVENVAQDGLFLLGAQGGYVWLPPDINDNPRATVDLGLRVPLWEYRGENRIPTLHGMETQLGRYVDENLRECLGDLSEFAEVDIVEKGELITTVDITDQLVLFTVDFPLDIKNKEGTIIKEITSFQTDIDFKLKRMHEVAEAIMLKESQQLKFEQIAVDLIALDPDIPLVGTDLSCSRKVWVKSDVERKLKELLRTNMPAVRIDSTAYVDVPRDQPYVLNHYVWDATEIPYNDISVGITFNENLPFAMEVGPRSGQLLRSGQLRGQDLASFVCLQQWNFVYDLEFPLVVTVEDSKNDYTLQFAFLVQVVDNRGNRDPLVQQVSSFAETADSEAYCANTYGDHVMKVVTMDNVTDPSFGSSTLPLSHVNISFTCLKYTCEMGTSGYGAGRVKAEASLTQVFPYCPNGIMRATKAGYKPDETFVTTFPDRQVTMHLTPIKTIADYTVVKHVLGENGVVTAARPLDEDESAFISITYKEGDVPSHETWGGFPATADIPLQPLTLLAQANFPYDIQIYLMNNEDLVGGYQATWTPNWALVENARGIEFHIIAKEAFTNENDRLAFLGGLKSLSNRHIRDPVIS
jgi:hypothetical protein